MGNGLPDFPPEWGKVEIPDDASELATDAKLVRRDLRKEFRAAKRRRARDRWRRRLRLPPRLDDPGEPSLFLPLLVIGTALLIALLSLLLMAWPVLTRPTPRQVDPGPSAVHPS